MAWMDELSMILTSDAFRSSGGQLMMNRTAKSCKALDRDSLANEYDVCMDIL